jgi:hypothetical protein
MIGGPDPLVFGRIWDDIQQHEQFIANQDWGAARPGHPEGTIGAHIRELHENLRLLRRHGFVTEPMLFWRLNIAIYVHDTFKPNSHARRPGSKAPPIDDPDSHASIAREFLAQYTDDPVLLATVQWHDEPFAIWRKIAYQRKVNETRWERLMGNIPDWPTFVTFCIIDGISGDKTVEPVNWFVHRLLTADRIRADEALRYGEMIASLDQTRDDRARAARGES